MSLALRADSLPSESGKPKYHVLTHIFPGGSEGKASAYNAGDVGLIPGLGGSPGGGNGNPPQCACLKNPTDRGAW